MGTPKALLEIDGRTFLESVIRSLSEGGCGEVVVVLGSQDEEPSRRMAEIAREQSAWVEINPIRSSEQIDSLRVGLGALSDLAEAAIVAPVDVPRISSAVVASLIAAFQASPSSVVVVPTLSGEHGHPTLFSRQVFPELLAPDLPEGARTVVHAHAAELLEVPVDEPGVLIDVDTPSDLHRLESGQV